MSKIVTQAVFSIYGKGATAEDAVTFMSKNGILSPNGIRDWQIRTMFKRMTTEEPKRTKIDIITEISVMDEVGRPSVPTIRKILGVSED